jgi:hypothetical protein
MMSPRRTAAEPENTRVRNAIEFVKLGFGDEFGLDFRSLYFRTEALTTDEAQAVMRLINYEEFDGVKVAEAIGQFKGRIAAYEFGREGSPVLYVGLPYWTHQCEGSLPGKAGTRIEDAESDSLAAMLKDTLVTTLGASEFEAVNADKRKLRVWWDYARARCCAERRR